jgi:Uma2 family endonuclease
MVMPATTRWTADMVRALPDDGKRYEVIDGELFVTPAPSWMHQSVVLELAMLLAPYVREHGVGHVIGAPAEVVFGPRNMVVPDVFAVPLVRGEAPRAWEEVGRLLLAIEVLSPSTRRTDRREKRELYQRKGVPEYWTVDVEARAIERWPPDASAPETVTEQLNWRPDAFVDPLTIDVAAFFARVLGPSLASA